MAFADPGTGRVIISSGKSPEPGKVVLAEACKEGDVLGYSSGWKRALATAGSVIQGLLVALQSGASGDTIAVSPDPVVEGYTGATPGSPVYVAEGTDNGKITQTAPTTSGDANKIIGYALTATAVQFCVTARADSTG